jgi:hypothetical protein
MNNFEKYTEMMKLHIPCQVIRGIFMADGNHHCSFPDKIFCDGSNTVKAIHIQRFEFPGGSWNFQAYHSQK